MAKDQGDAFSAGIKAAIGRIEPTAPKSSAAPDPLDVIADVVKKFSLNHIKFAPDDGGGYRKCSEVEAGLAAPQKCYITDSNKKGGRTH